MNPNYVTFASIAFMAVAAYLVFKGLLVNAAVFFVASCVCDSLDGVVARMHRQASSFGMFFDRTADRVNDALIIGAIIIAGYVTPLVGVSAMVTVMIASYMSSVMESATKTRVGERLSLRYIRMPVLLLGLVVPHPLALQTAMAAVLVTGLYGMTSRFVAALRILR